jgi:hypothetical protein
LVTVTLPLATVFNSFGAILGQILPSSSGATYVCPRTAGGRRAGAGGGSRRDGWCPTLQEIGRRAARSSPARCPGRAGGGTRNVEEII